MRGLWWALAALVAAIAWNAAFTHLMARAGASLNAANPIGFGLFVLNCLAVSLALRLRTQLKSTGSGATRARFDTPGTMLAYRMVAAVALALTIAVPGLLIAWIAPLVG